MKLKMRSLDSVEDSLLSMGKKTSERVEKGAEATGSMFSKKGKDMLGIEQTKKIRLF